MNQVQPDVWETATQSPFPGLKTHAYLLTQDDGNALFFRNSGNVLFYNTGHVYEIENFEQLGGVSRQYLSHEDELGDTLNTIAKRYGSLLVGHENELAAFSKVRKPDITFNQREVHLGYIEIIPTPGHSPGSTCFLVHSSTGKNYLFTGDTLFRGKNGQWSAGFIKGHHDETNRAELADSLRLLATLQPDVVFGSAFTGEQGFEKITDNSWPDKVHHALAQLLNNRNY